MKTKTTLIFAAMFSLISGVMHAQQDPETPKSVENADESIYNAVEVRPEFPGGMQAFYEYVGKNFNIPKNFKGSGKIISQFVVEKDGSLTSIKVLRDVGAGTAEETIRVLKASPKWKPGIQNGRPVRVMYSLPISLQEKK